MSGTKKIVKRLKSGEQITVLDETLEGTANEGLKYRDFVSLYLGRALPHGAVIHHKNRNRRDNNIENLLLVPNQSLHMYIHSLIKSGRNKMVSAFEAWLGCWMALIKENPKQDSLELLLVADKNLINSYEEVLIKDESQDEVIAEYSFAVQYSKFKAKYADKVVLIQKGNYYVCYGNDAIKLNKELDWDLYYESFMEEKATGCPITNLGFEKKLQQNNISYVLVDQSDIRSKKVLDRYVRKVII